MGTVSRQPPNSNSSLELETSFEITMIVFLFLFSVAQSVIKILRKRTQSQFSFYEIFEHY